MVFQEKHKTVGLYDGIKKRKESAVFSCMNLLPLSEILGGKERKGTFII